MCLRLAGAGKASPWLRIVHCALPAAQAYKPTPQPAVHSMLHQAMSTPRPVSSLVRRTTTPPPAPPPPHPTCRLFSACRMSPSAVKMMASRPSLLYVTWWEGVGMEHGYERHCGGAYGLRCMPEPHPRAHYGIWQRPCPPCHGAPHLPAAASSLATAQLRMCHQAALRT